jgi:MFS family permease
VAVVAFVLRELRARHPMMNVRVFRSGVYSAAIYAAFAVLFCVYGTLFLITQYFQNVRAYSPEQAGVLMLAMSVPTVVAAPLTGRIVAARGGRGPTLLGISCAAIGTGILAASSAALLPVTLIGIFFAGISGGIGVAAATSVAMGAIPAQRSGMASGILSTTRGLGSTAGFAIMGSILAGTIATLLPQRLEPLIPNVADRNEVVAQVVDGANPRAVTALIGPGEPLPDNVTTDQAVLQATDDVFVDGIRVAMLVGLGVALSSLVLAWFLFPRRAPPAAEEDRATYALARSADSGNATA